MLKLEKSVFISYRREDFPWARAIFQHLRANGFDVFMDYTGIPSGAFESEIFENVRSRAHFLLLLTPTTLSRCSAPQDLLRREIEEAIGTRRNIVPLFLEGFSFSAPASIDQLSGSLEHLCRYNGLTVPNEYFEAAMERLCNQFLNAPLDTIQHPTTSGIRGHVREEVLIELRENLTSSPSRRTTTDTLTALPNRKDMEDRVASCIARIRREEGYGAFCHIDLDRFDLVNEFLGHDAGDRLLQQIGLLLRSKVQWKDTVGRMGGNDFGLLLEGVVIEDAQQIAEDLRGAISSLRFEWADQVMRVGASVGVVAIHPTSETAHQIFIEAEHACRASKVRGRDQVTHLVENDAELVRRKRETQWAGRLETALQMNRLSLHRMRISPLQSKEDGERYEMLLRLNDDGRLTLPDHFMAAAERYNLTPALDRWVITHTFDWLAGDRTRQDRTLMCSINLSGQSLADERFLPFILAEFRRSQVDASRVCFEIAETSAVANFSYTSRFVSSLKQAGCKVALDDFGTGVSSFGHLKHFPVDYLKIDGSFVRNLLSDPINHEMVRSINEVGHLTGKRTIAESAENQETVRTLTALGVDYAQGYGISVSEPIAPT